MATKAGTFAAYPYDEGLDVNNLPDAPWTPEALGAELFNRLCRICGAGDISKHLGASIDPRSFARGRAAVVAQSEGATDERKRELFAEAEILQTAINAKLPAPTGTPRNQNAPPLTGATTIKRQRTY